ncbi:hypothetical protein ACQKWADRAFT_329966 [Trichoderma austrokoningii]
MDAPEEESMAPIDYAAQQHCILCRRKIRFCSNDYNRTHDVGDNQANFEDWETEVLALGFVDSKISGIADMKHRVFCHKMILVFLGDVYEAGNKMRFRIQPCVTLRTAGPVFFVHCACSERARLVKPKPSFEELYNLGLKLTEIMPRDCFLTQKLWHLASFASGNTIVDSEGKSLLLKCNQLPTEIQGRILSFINEDKEAFSLLTSLTSCSLIHTSPPSVVLHPDNITDLVPRSNKNATYVCASFNNIFGVDYLSHVVILSAPIDRDALDRRCACVEVDTGRICNMEVMLGPVGILALRFYLTDGSKSSWLGSAERGWRCGPINATRRDIKLLKNGHKNVFKQFSRMHSQQCTPDYRDILPVPLLWDVTRDLPDSGDAFLASTSLRMWPHYWVLNGLMPQIMCSYLPLRDDGNPVKGITVYSCDEDTSGVIVHTKSADVEVSAPRRRGTPTSFYFRDGEEILTIGLVYFDHWNHATGPFLLFKTNQQRLAYFGPSTVLYDPYVKYVSLIPRRLEQTCAVAGLIVNTLWMTESKLPVFGTHCEARKYPETTGETAPPLSRCQVSHPVIPETVLDTWCHDQMKATRAKLAEIRQLRIQKRLIMPECDLRCAGLLIHHMDGSIETLGSYDGSLTAPSELIYDGETDGELHDLVFHLKLRQYRFKGIKFAYYVSDIVAHSEDFEPKDTEDEEAEESEDDRDEEEDWYPATCTFYWSKYSSQPFVTWCFNRELDHIYDDSVETRHVLLQEHLVSRLRIR